MHFREWRRRDVLHTLLGGAAAAWPLAARAQQPAMPVVGFLRGTTAAGESAHIVTAFGQGLQEAGFAEGRNVGIESRWADGQIDRLPDLANDLVRRQVAVIVASAGPAVLAAKAATNTIPIVFTTGLDPVALGFVTRLNRPGGNVTGVTTLAAELQPKRLELLHELVPAAMDIALLVNPATPGADVRSKELQAAASARGLRLHVLRVDSERDLDAVFASLLPLRAGGLLFEPDTLFTSQGRRLGALTVRHALPAIYQFRAFAEAGGLMSYGGSVAESHRQAGIYAGRILKGEKPGELPVQQVTKVEMILNLKTAKALGLDVPPSLLARADEVIE